MNKAWLQHYPSEIPVSLDYPDLLVQDMLQQAYENKPDNIAIRFIGKSLTYAELYDSALKCANMLRSLGVKPGDRVSLMLPNCPQYVISYYGAMFAGAIVVQTNPLYVERELEHQLNDASVQTMIALDLVYPKVSKVKDKTPLKNIIVTSIKDYLPFPKNLLYPIVQRKKGMHVKIKYKKNTHSFMTLLANAETTRPEIDMTADQVALLQYTGGTTGMPKGVMLTHKNLVDNTLQCSSWVYKATYGQEVSLGAVPFFHVYGMTVVMNLTIYLAGSMVLIPKFDVLDVLKAIQKEKPTLFPGAPTMYIALINHPDVERYDLSSIKACLSGSSALPIDVQQTFEKLTNGKLVEGYGLSETSPVTHANFIWGKQKIGSIGVPWPDTDANVFSESGEPVEIGAIGEIGIKGPQVMKGYWNQPNKTEESFTDGWFMTGDMGYMDEDGFFYVVDRKKDVIIAGGYNVYPREVEEVLYEHAAVQECSVIGVSDEYRGETVKAFIVLKQDTQVTNEQLDAFCREKLAAYKVPKLYEFRDELPKSMIGKVLKRVLVEEEKEKRTAEQEQSKSS